MSTIDVDPSDLGPLAGLATPMWAAALVTFGAGDVITTHVGLQDRDVEEGSPVAREVLDAGGTGGMVATKAALFGAAYLAYQRTPAEYRVGIPLGLALLGAWIVAHNAAVLAST